MKCKKKNRTIVNTMLSLFFYISILMLLLTATAVVYAEQPDITKQRIGLEISEYNSYVNTEPSKKIEEFQHQIYNKGYNYTVAENGITRLTPEEREQILG